MYREGDWKIVHTNNESWSLFNLADDMTETMDLSESNPEKTLEMINNLKTWESQLPGGKAQF
jgi:hypothetical protein